MVSVRESSQLYVLIGNDFAGMLTPDKEAEKVDN